MNSSSHPSEAFRGFAASTRYGPAFDSDPGVWTRYIAPSLDPCYRRWRGARGTRNAFGYEFDFEVGLVMNKSAPNAVCASDRGKHFILVYHTLPMCLLEFFCRLLSRKEILAETGSSDREVGWAGQGLKSPPGFAVMMGEATISHIDDLVSQFGPKCPERRRVALELYTHALRFVIEHEMGHAVQGHVQFAEEQLGLRGLSESALTFAASSNSRRDRILIHLEGMADKGSYFSVISAPILDRMHTPYAVLSSGDTGLIEEVKLKLLAGAFLGTFWMLSDIVGSGGDLRSHEQWYDHPSSLARSIAFVLMPLAQANKLPPEIAFFINKAVAAAVQELSKLSDTIGFLRPFRWIGRQDMYANVFEPFVLSENEAAALNTELKPYRYVPS